MTMEGHSGDHKYTVDHIPANELEIDPKIQRAVLWGRVDRIASNFSEEALGIITVSRRGSGLLTPVHDIVLDGQTRLLAVRAVAGTDETALPMLAHIYHNLTREEEAKIFLSHNDRAAVSPLDLYRISLKANEEWALDIHRIVDRYGFEVGINAPVQRRFTAIGAAKKILRTPGGIDSLDRAFDTITRAWGHQRRAASAETVSGLGLLYLRHNGKVDHRALVLHMKEEGDALSFCGSVKQRAAALRVSVAEASYHRLVQLHDKGKKAAGTRKLGKELS